MKQVRSLLYLLLFTFFSLKGLRAEEIEWVHNYNAGMKLARETLRPVMIDFWASWCGPCKAMDTGVYTDHKLIEASKKFVFIQIDVDHDQAEARSFNADVIPTMVFLDPWGDVLMRRQGFALARELLEMMKPIPPSFAPVARNFQAVSENKGNFDALMGIGAFYKQAGFIVVARDFYNRALKTPRAREERAARDEVTIALGLLALSANDPKEAEKIFEKGCKDCEPKNESSMLLGLAKSYVQRKKIKEAKEILQTVASRFPGTPHAQVAKDNLEQLK